MEKEIEEYRTSIVTLEKRIKDKEESEREFNKQILELKYNVSEARSEISLLKLQSKEDESKSHKRRRTTTTSFQNPIEKATEQSPVFFVI